MAMGFGYIHIRFIHIESRLKTEWPVVSTLLAVLIWKPFAVYNQFSPVVGSKHDGGEPISLCFTGFTRPVYFYLRMSGFLHDDVLHSFFSYRYTYTYFFKNLI